MSNWYLAKDSDVLMHNNKALTVSDRIPYIDIKCPDGFDPQAAGCGKYYGSWTQINVSDNVWRFSCKYSKWHDLFYNNRATGRGDFLKKDGDFECVGSGNTDLIIYMDGLFRECTGLVSCVTIDTKNCVNLSAMFSNTRLTEIPYLDGSSNLDWNSFAVACHYLRHVNENIDTSAGKSFWRMFAYCENLETVPTIDLTNADDTYQSEFSPYPGNFMIFKECKSLTYVHLIGGAGIAAPNGMFYNAGIDSAQKLTIDWDNHYMPLVTGFVLDPDWEDHPQEFEAIAPMFYPQTFSPGYAATYAKVSDLNFPNLVHGPWRFFPSAKWVGNITMPNIRITDSDTHYSQPKLIVAGDCTHIGTLDFSNMEYLYGSAWYIPDKISQLFFDALGLTEFPTVLLPSIPASVPTDRRPDIMYIFCNMRNVGSGAYAFYQELVSKGYDRSLHPYAFSNCGINTQEGSADLAQIPSDWKQPY